MAYKRRHFLTHRNYQLRYTAYIVAAMLTVAAAISILTFTLVYPMLSSKLSNAVTETISRDLAKGLLFSYWASVFVLVVVASVFGVLFSHRIVGPINRMAAITAMLEEGDMSKRIVLRNRDEFMPLADAINSLMDRISGALRSSTAAASLSGHELEELEKMLSGKKILTDELKAKIDSVRKKQDEIRGELTKYKVN